MRGVVRLLKILLVGAKAPAPAVAHSETVPPPQSETGRGLVKRITARLSWKWRLALGLPFVGACLLMPLFGALMVYYTIVFPHPLSMRNKEHAPVIRILARDGSVLAERGAAHDYMPIDLLPRHVTGAVVAIEDRRFYEHSGIDPAGFVRAIFANLRAGRFAQGGSTLTQQLAKNLFLTSERKISRKIEELALALWLELRLSKDAILELYLNRVYFGAGAYGIEAASQRYFDKSARELTINEAALIAGLLKAPSKYSPLSSPEIAKSRSRVVIDKMAETGVITAEEEQRALGAPFKFSEVKSQTADSGLDYAIDFVLEKLPPLIGEGHAEIVVETTIDASLQKKAGDIATRAMARRGEALGASQVALVVLDSDGGIRALIGGRSYSESQFNRAVKAKRQPGSVFKPFVYLAAMEHGLTPDSITYDLPLSIGGWAPRNDNGMYAGEITLRKAISQSVNTVAVRLNQDLGRGRTVEVARRLGVTSELRDDSSLPLGTSEVTLLEMTGAYDTFSNGGALVEPHAIRRVRMSSGRVLFARQAPRTAQVGDPMHVGYMNDMLASVVTSGTGRRAALAGHASAGKTGTSQDNRDAWFIGYTSHMTAGVWIGNDNGKPMKNAVGGGLPAEIWHEVMAAAHVNLAPLALPGVAAPVFDFDRRLPQESAKASPSDVPPSLPAVPAARPQAAKEPSPKDKSESAAHPVQRIDEEFVAKALKGIDTNAADETVQAEVPAPRNRPQGMMSLGGWW